jgi:hypothetical protein
MADIVERLYELTDDQAHFPDVYRRVCADAAREIERLRAELDREIGQRVRIERDALEIELRLREALKGGSGKKNGSD